MKFIAELPETQNLIRGEVIALFGHATLVRDRDRRYRLLGGTAVDRAEALEWISLFHAEIVLVE